MQQFKRRNYVVNRRLQFGLIAVFLTTVLLSSVISVICLTFFLNTARELGPELFLDTFLVPILINDLIIMTAVVIVGVFFSNRIAGPLLHIHMVLDKVIQGDLGKRIVLRPNDYVQGIADDINTLLDKIDK